MKHETLQRVTAMQADIIMMMANLIEGRDGTTGEHVKRASIYVNMLLNRLVEKGIYKEELDSVTTEYIRNAAPLHDIGKITITDIILQKPASLTQEEYDIMKHHSAEGGRLIVKIWDGWRTDVLLKLRQIWHHIIMKNGTVPVIRMD